MDVHAGLTELPEWQAFLASFQVRFRRPEGRAALARDTTGLLTEVPNQTGDTRAQAVPGTSAQRLQAFRTTMAWDEADLHRQRVQQMVDEATRGAGVLVCDDTGCPTPGKASGGGARQYSGTLGQVGHCQVAVTCCDTERQVTGPVAVRLDLPKPWAYDPARRQQARVPAALALQTKPEIALQLLDQARAWGVPHRGVVADADDGDNPTFLAGLEARQEPDVVAGRPDFAVSLGPAVTSPVWRAEARRHTVPRWQWRTSRWRRGTQGWWRKQCVAVRCGRVTGEGPGQEGWLVGERATRGPPEDRQYFWSNLPGETPLAELAGMAHRRQASEPCHEEAQGELGWDQDQGRLWPGCHRPAVTVMLAYSVRVGLELRERRRHQREGRRRHPLSPSPNVSAPDAAGRAS